MIHSGLTPHTQHTWDRTRQERWWRLVGKANNFHFEIDILKFCIKYYNVILTLVKVNRFHTSYQQNFFFFLLNSTLSLQSTLLCINKIQSEQYWRDKNISVYQRRRAGGLVHEPDQKHGPKSLATWTNVSHGLLPLHIYSNHRLEEPLTLSFHYCIQEHT